MAASLAAVLVACNSVQPPEAAEEFSFIQVTDIHLGGTNNRKRAESVAKEINALPFKIEFVAVTGDIFDKGPGFPDQQAAFLAFVNNFSVPVHCLPGNHDILPGTEREDASTFERLAGGLCKRAEAKGFVLLFLYVEPLTGKVSVEGQAPLDWLEESLKASDGKPVIVFIHTPPTAPLYNMKEHPSPWPPEAIGRWESLLRQYNVKAVIAGHFHRDELHYDGGVPLFIAPPVSSKYGRQSTYRVYTWREGRLEYSTQYLSED